MVAKKSEPETALGGPLRKSGKGTVRGYFPSLTEDRMVAWEGPTEGDYLYVADQDVRVTSIKEQPLRIRYFWNGRWRWYTLDFLLREDGRFVLVECKDHRWMGDEQNEAKWKAAREDCAERAWEFRLVTDLDLRAGHLLGNVKRLTYYRDYRVPMQTQLRVGEVLRDTMGPVALGALLAAMGDAPLGTRLGAVLHLAYHHIVILPLADGPIADATPVSLPSAPPLE